MEKTSKWQAACLGFCWLTAAAGALLMATKML